MNFSLTSIYRRKKKKKLNIFSPPAEGKGCIENEIKKPKEHDWEEFRSDNQLEKIAEVVVAYQTSVTFIAQNEKNQRMADNDNNPPNDGNEKDDKKGE